MSNLDQLGVGMIDEHAPRPEQDEKKNPAEYNPTPEENKAIRLVEKLFDKAKKNKSLYANDWLKLYRFFRGKQWDGEARPSYRHKEVINHVFRVIQSIVPIQLDARPRFEFLPQEPGDLELSVILNEAAEADWSSNNWSMELLEVLYDANIYGTGLSCVKFDKIKQKISYESSDPFHHYPDPDATDVNKKSMFHIVAEPMTVDKIKLLHPDKKDFIKPDLLDLLKSEKTENGEFIVRSPVDNRVMVEGNSTADITQKDKALYLTCYISPDMLKHEFEDVEQPVMGMQPVYDEMGQQVGEEQVQVGVEYVQVAKYPKGRKITLCNRVLLDDGPNEYDDAEFPYERNVNYCLPREFWGSGEVEQILSPQKIFNKVFNFALDVLTLMGNPIWLNPSTGNVDSENLINRPGLVVDFDPNEGGPPTRVEGVQLQPYVMQIARDLEQWIDGLSGSQDVSRGVQPTGVTAASAISQLQEAAQTRIRQKVRNTDCYLQDVGRHWLSRTFQYTTAPQIYRLTNHEGANKYFRMRVEPMDYEDGSVGKKVVVTNFTENGQEDPNIKVYETRGKMDVRVSSGSSLPFNKDAKEQKLLSLFDRGIIDRKEVLKGSDYPNWQSVEQRIAEKEAQAAAAEAPPPQSA